MKKYFFTAVAVLTIAASGYTCMQNQKTTALSDLALEDLEALARWEDSTCPNGCLIDPGLCNCRGEQPYREAK